MSPHGQRPRRQPGGFTLVELMVGIAIMAILLGLAAPSYSTWIQNTQIRTLAESIYNAAQLARSEALKRNATVRLQLVNDLSGGCAASTTGTAWVVSLFDASSLCDANPDNVTSPTAAGFNAATNPLILQKALPGAASAQVNAGQGVLCFNGLGQLATIAGVCNAAATTISVSSSNGTCKAAGGDMRCLDINVSAGGLVHFCDPAVTDTTDPRHC